MKVKTFLLPFACFCLLPFSFLLLFVTACTERAPTASEPAIQLHPANAQQPAYIEVSPLPSGALSSLRSARLTPDDWHALLKVTVGTAPDDSTPPVEGRYAATDGGITFVPLFPFDAGRDYVVSFDRSRLPGAVPQGERSGTMTRVVGLTAVGRAASTRVTAVHPSSDLLPENTLRLYIEFSAPMGNGDATKYVKLLDEAGREVPVPFLPVEAAFWNGEHTRYTLFFDPGRVKQDILPNRELGRPLLAGHRYTLEISTDWRDAGGQPLAVPYRRAFRVGPAEARALTLASWRIAAPAPGTREPLIVTFPAPLDHGLAARAIAVEADGGRQIDGEVALEAADTRWALRPRLPWESGKYRLVARAILEDPAGNQIGRPFEVDMKQTPVPPTPDAYRLEFRIGEPGL